jgi:hypothetical protein
MWQLLLSLYQRGNILGLRTTSWGCPQPRLKAQHDTRPTWPKIDDAAPYCGHTEWPMNLLELGLEPKECVCCIVSNASKNTSFRRRMEEILAFPFRVASWVRTGCEDQVRELIEDQISGVSSMVMSSSPTLQSSSTRWNPLLFFFSKIVLFHEWEISSLYTIQRAVPGWTIQGKTVNRCSKGGGVLPA